MTSVGQQSSVVSEPSARPPLAGRTFKQLNDFIVSASNRDTCHQVISRASSGASGGTFVYGPVGCGKTHLLQGVSVKTGGGFIPLASHGHDEPLSKLFEVRADSRQSWLIDDMEWVCGSRDFQNTLYKAFSTFLRAGGHLIVSCDRSLSDLSISGINRQLFNLLNGFEELKIDHHDDHLVREYLARQLDVALDQSQVHQMPLIQRVLQYHFSSMHDVKSAANALVMVSHGQPLDEQAVARVVECYASPHPSVVVSVESIRDLICDAFDVTVQDLASKSRQQKYVRARHALCLLARRLTDVSLVALGNALQRDHTTIIHAVRKGEEMCVYDPEFGFKVGEVLRLCRS